MKRIWKWLVPLTLSVFVLSVPMVARAALIWDSLPANGTVDPISPSGLNIFNAYHGYDDTTGTHYFRINLGSTLDGGNTNTLTTASKSTALGSYKIFIDLTPNVVFQYNTKTLGNFNYSWDFSGSTFTTGLTGNAPTAQSATQFASTYLEWRYVDPASGTGHIGLNFNWWAQTLNGSGTVLETTGTATATPIPNAAWLLGSGIIGLIGLQRRRARKAK